MSGMNHTPKRNPALMKVGIYADFSGTCKGCESVVDEEWGKNKVAHRCFAEGPCKGRVVGVDFFDPCIPAWCPKLEHIEFEDEMMIF